MDGARHIGDPPPLPSSAPAQRREVAPRVLVVEDDDNIRDVLLQTLSADGFEVRAAANGLDGLAYATTFRPDLILLDLIMGYMNGWNFAERYRLAEPRPAPIIVMTAASAGAAQAAAEIGAVEFILKPFELAQVLASVHRYTDSLSGQDVSSILPTR